MVEGIYISRSNVSSRGLWTRHDGCAVQTMAKQPLDRVGHDNITRGNPVACGLGQVVPGFTALGCQVRGIWRGERGVGSYRFVFQENDNDVVTYFGKI